MPPCRQAGAALFVLEAFDNNIDLPLERWPEKLSAEDCPSRLSGHIDASGQIDPQTDLASLWQEATRITHEELLVLIKRMMANKFELHRREGDRLHPIVLALAERYQVTIPEILLEAHRKAEARPKAA